MIRYGLAFLLLGEALENYSGWFHVQPDMTQRLYHCAIVVEAVKIIEVNWIDKF